MPTIAEAGFPKGEFNFWVGMLAPGGLPADLAAAPAASPWATRLGGGLLLGALDADGQPWATMLHGTPLSWHHA